MHELLYWVAWCVALSVATGDASPGALVAALGGMLCYIGVAAKHIKYLLKSDKLEVRNSPIDRLAF